MAGGILERNLINSVHCVWNGDLLFSEPKIFVTAELWKAHANEPLGISLMERKYDYTVHQ